MKVFLISHISDADGITPLILANLVFDKVDYFLLESSEAETKIPEILDENDFTDYDMVYITDLMLSNKAFEIIDTDEELKKKVRVFDHHIGSLFAAHYSFATIVDTNNKMKRESAASLFYKYLLKTFNNKHLKTKAVKDFVELVRLYDVWEWKETNKLKAKQLADLFTMYGRVYFFEHYLSFFKKNKTFSFSDKEKFLLEIENKRIQNYIEEKKKRIISAAYREYKVGIVFASKYRSELGNNLATFYKKEFDFIIIISLEGNISYRGVKDVNLNDIAQVFGGGGHKDASGSPLPKDIQKEVIKMIFNNKINI